MIASNDTVTTSTTNKNVIDLSKYNVFVAECVNTNGGSVSVGIRRSATSIRFAGFSRKDSTNYTTLYYWTVSGDTISSVSVENPAPGDAGLANVYGVV